MLPAVPVKVSEHLKGEEYENVMTLVAILDTHDDAGHYHPTAVVLGECDALSEVPTLVGPGSRTGVKLNVQGHCTADKLLEYAGKVFAGIPVVNMMEMKHQRASLYRVHSAMEMAQEKSAILFICADENTALDVIEELNVVDVLAPSNSH